MRAACPPRPKVASTYRRGSAAGAAIARAATASSTSTGACSANGLLSAARPSERQVTQAGGSLFGALLAFHPRVALHLPARFVPQLEAAPLPDDPRGAFKARELAQLRREREAAVAVDHHLLRVANEQ